MRPLAKECKTMQFYLGNVERPNTADTGSTESTQETTIRICGRFDDIELMRPSCKAYVPSNEEADVRSTQAEFHRTTAWGHTQILPIIVHTEHGRVRGWGKLARTVAP